MGKFISAIAMGFLGFAFPRFLIAAGVPLESWVESAGRWFGLTMDEVNTEIFLWGSSIILAVMLAGFETWKHPAARFWRKIYPPKTNPKVELTPSSGPSPDIRLAVKNLGDSGKFYATCRPIGTGNNVNNLRTSTFNLGWVSSPKRTIKIAKSESQELILAQWVKTGSEEIKQFDILEWSAVGFKTFEGARFIGRERHLPEFDLEISVFKKDANKPKVARYTLRPASKYGPPLELVPIPNEGPNMRLADAVAWLVGSRNFLQNKNKTANALSLVREKASMGHLTVWGKVHLPDSPLGRKEPRKPIEKDYWQTYHFDLMEFLNEAQGKTEQTESHAKGQIIYRDLWLNRENVEGVLNAPQ